MKEIPFQLYERLRSPLARFSKLSIIERIYCSKFACFFPVYFLVQGNKMYVDIGDKMYTPHVMYVYEKFQTQLFKRMVKKGMVVVDVGANIGWYTLIAAKRVGEKGKVYAFEPDPNNCALLAKNVYKNRYNNVVVEQEAILDRCGFVKLFLSPVSTADHRIFDLSNRRKWIRVRGTTLDEYFRDKNDRIDVVKIDIQGAEMAAILGMDRIIKANENLKIFVEFWPDGIAESGFSSEEFLNKLLKYGFKVYLINERKGVMALSHFDEIIESCQDGLTQIDEVTDLFGRGFVNLLLQR